jgi:hypothetical protein
MNELKLDLDKKFDGAETSRERNSKLNDKRRKFNFPISPRKTKNKSLNIINVSVRPISKFISKNAISNKSNLDEVKKSPKIKINNNIKNSNNNIIKSIKKIELIEKDINNFKEFKKIIDTNNDLFFQKMVLNRRNKKSNIFKNSNNLTYSNKLKSDNFDIKLGNGEINKINITTILEFKNKPLIVKLDPKRSSSSNCMNEKTNNETIKVINNDLYTRYVSDEEVKIIKTPRSPPSKKIYLENGKDKVKESIYINKNSIETKDDTGNKESINDKINLLPEEYHFKAVLYSQELKKLNFALG